MSCRTQTRAGEDGPFCQISSVIWAQTSLNLAGRSLLPASPPGPTAGPAGVHRQGGREAPVTHDLPALEDSQLPGHPACCITPLAAPDCGPALDLSPPTSLPLEAEMEHHVSSASAAHPGAGTGFSCPSSDSAIPPAPHAAGRRNCPVLVSRAELGAVRRVQPFAPLSAD